MSTELWVYRARLHRLIDSDTFSLGIDLGFGVTHTIRVRLADVDAPERFTPEGIAATTWVQGWFTHLFSDMTIIERIDNWPLIIRTRLIKGRHGIAQDLTFGRFVADIWSSASGANLADALVAAGYARRV